MNEDIYSYGFDRSLNKELTPIQSPVVYDIQNQTDKALLVQAGNIVASGLTVNVGKSTDQGGAGASISITAGVGSPSPSATTGNGGAVNLTGGVGALSSNGGRVNITGGVSGDGGFGGGVIISGGAGGGTNADSEGVTISGGTGLGTGGGGDIGITAGMGGTGLSGDAILSGGAASPSGATAGDGIVRGGTGSSSGGYSAGNAKVLGGAALTANGNGGNVVIAPGVGVGSGTNGSVQLKNAALTVIEYIELGQQTTTTNAQTVAFTYTMADNSMLQIEAFVAARRTGGSGGTAGDSAGYIVAATYKRTGGGGSTAVGAITAVHTGEDQAAWDATFTNLNNDVRLSVTGATNNNVTWNYQVRYLVTTT